MLRLTERKPTLAYSSNRSALDDTGKSILVQVAFKAAVELTAAYASPAAQPAAVSFNEEGRQAFRETFGFLVDTLFGEVEARLGVNSDPSQGDGRPGWTDEELGRTLVDELGAVPIANFEEPAPAPAPGLTVRGTQHGPLPGWLASAAKKAGVTEVYDNRDGLAENPKRPWFKGAKGQPLSAKGEPFAFWPPKD